MTESKNWWEVSQHSYDGYFSASSWAHVGLGVLALAGGPPVRSFSATVQISEDKTHSQFLQEMEKAFPELSKATLSAHARSDDEEGGTVADYFNKETGIHLSFGVDTALGLHCSTTNQDFVKKFSAWIEANSTTTPPPGRVHVMVQGPGGLSFRNMGIGGRDIERGNYSAKVLAGVDRIIKDLNSENPAGRVAILNGKPGTGKTYLIRGLLNEIKDVTMVIVPSNLVAGLAQPEVIPALTNLRSSSGSRPIVFLIEDADEVVSARDGMNMSAVSTVLNLGDGILGSLLDIRIVCTTNAHQLDLDKAIMRPGRLSASVSVGELSMEEAQSVLTRLSPGSVLEHKNIGYTLAEVYSLARNNGWEPATKDRAPIGFLPDGELKDICIPGNFHLED